MKPLKQAIYSSRTADKFVVRLPDGMREKVAQAARNTHRSMNSEIIARLEESLNTTEMEELAKEAAAAATPATEAELAPIEPWNPVVGMAVTCRSGQHVDKPLIIHRLAIGDKGELFAIVSERPGGKEYNVKELKPFIVK